MSNSTQQTIWDEVESVFSGHLQMAFAITGGGSSLLNWLFNHPGASRVLIDAQIPYNPAALEAYLAYPGPHRVEADTAYAMAVEAFRRARSFVDAETACLGVGLTAALATNRSRRGADRVHAAFCLNEAVYLSELQLEKDRASRQEQEEVLSHFALSRLVGFCGGTSDYRLPDWATQKTSELRLDDPLELLLRGDIELVEIDRDGTVRIDVERRGRLLYPGSFNPLHAGHEGLARAARRLSGRPVALEMSIENVDKPPLERGELERRLQQVAGRYPICLTREPTFCGKARHFGDIHFAIGYDTAVRLVDGKYYEDGAAGMRRDLGNLLEHSARFWVAGRRIGQDYCSLEDVDVPKELEGLFSAIPESEFRMDISSTKIRARQKSV